MSRSYYQNKIIYFVNEDTNKILGIIARNNEFALEEKQRGAWIYQIKLLKKLFKELEEGFIAFEYTIPRMGKRIDNVVIYKGVIFLLEFKVGSGDFYKHDVDQVYDYGLDLKNFHEESYDKNIVPILIATEANEENISIRKNSDGLFEPIRTNINGLLSIMDSIVIEYGSNDIDCIEWINSRYRPTPTIIEAAQALYKGHNVEEISRSDSGAKNLNETTDYINKVIDFSKDNKKKSICFLTGVPGAGKTLAGLNIGTSRQKYEDEEHAVFLSGNGPLVKVLREALAKDDNLQNGTLLGEARRKSSVFIQNIHHFRDAAIKDERAPVEKVAIFDEAQRAWDKKETSRFMNERGEDINMSEPDFLISVMDRHEDWACIVCLIGGGQEIHKGEAGLKEWFDSINKYKDWEVHLSDRIIDEEYLKLNDLKEVNLDCSHSFTPSLHLSTSIRSFRTEKLSDLVRSILNIEKEKSIELYKNLKDKYPIYITRDLKMAKKFLKYNARGTERYGIVGSSDARRLKADGLDVKSGIDVENWFLSDKDDIRSSYYLEDIATEFDIQGLELDWTCVAWDGDLRYEDKGWTYKSFSGTSWKDIHQESRRLHKKNSYRVLLTRARQGMVIYIPEGDIEDHTRNPEYYDGTFKYLSDIGLDLLSEEYFKESIDEKEIEVKLEDLVLEAEEPMKEFKPVKSLKKIELEKKESKGEVKIGKLVQETMAYMSTKDLLDNDEILKLQEEEYSKRVFNLNYPFMVEIDRSKDLKEQRLVNNYPRYWTKVFNFKGSEYYICSEWYEKPNRSFFEGWRKNMLGRE